MRQLDQFHDTIRGRLKRVATTPSELRNAMAVLHEIIRWLDWPTPNCTKTAVELADLLNIDEANLSGLIQLLETVGAITRVKNGRSKTIIVTPHGGFADGAFRPAAMAAELAIQDG